MPHRPCGPNTPFDNLFSCNSPHRIMSTPYSHHVPCDLVTREQHGARKRYRYHTAMIGNDSIPKPSEIHTGKGAKAQRLSQFFFQDIDNMGRLSAMALALW